MDAFGKIVEIIITVILLFVAPLYIVAGMKDISNQIYLNTQTTIFVDTVRNQGYVDSSLYESYCNMLESTGNIYDIEMIHYCQMYDEEYNKYYYSYYNDNIIPMIYDSGYLMNSGDLFSVRIVMKNQSLFDKLTSTIIGADGKEDSILCYGGIIRDEAY